MIYDFTKQNSSQSSVVTRGRLEISRKRFIILEIRCDPDHSVFLCPSCRTCSLLPPALVEGSPDDCKATPLSPSPSLTFQYPAKHRHGILVDTVQCGNQGTLRTKNWEDLCIQDTRESSETQSEMDKRYERWQDDSCHVLGVVEVLLRLDEVFLGMITRVFFLAQLESD